MLLRHDQDDDFDPSGDRRNPATPRSFASLLEHAPFAIEKIAGNLECYVKELEKLGR
jgi:hypothetical protein